MSRMTPEREAKLRAFHKPGGEVEELLTELDETRNDLTIIRRLLFENAPRVANLIEMPEWMAMKRLHHENADYLLKLAQRHLCNDCDAARDIYHRIDSHLAPRAEIQKEK